MTSIHRKEEKEINFFLKTVEDGDGVRAVMCVHVRFSIE